MFKYIKNAMLILLCFVFFLCNQTDELFGWGWI